MCGRTHLWDHAGVVGGIGLTVEEQLMGSGYRYTRVPVGVQGLGLGIGKYYMSRQLAWCGVCA